MPKVGDKHFSYSKKGRAAAEAEAKRTDKPVENADKFKAYLMKKHGGGKK